MGTGLRALAVSLGVLAAGRLQAQESHLLVVTGLGGEPQYSDAFHQWASAMVDAAEKKYGVPAAEIVYLGEKPERDPARIDGPSTKASLEKTMAELAARLHAEDTSLVLLIGHGSSQAGEARFNLPGPDLTGAELARLLDPLPGQVAVVAAFSASGDLVKTLAGKGRIVVTATRSGMERNESVFARYFVEAFAGDGADADKDGRVSLLEAFEYARREVARSYETENRLLTEHALLDDNGGRAGTWFLGGRAAAVAAGDPRAAALQAERDAVQRRIDALKARKPGMEVAAYEEELERLLLELAVRDKALRSAAAKGAPRP